MHYKIKEANYNTECAFGEYCSGEVSNLIYTVSISIITGMWDEACIWSEGQVAVKALCAL